jgi:hypothetical protein
MVRGRLGWAAQEVSDLSIVTVVYICWGGDLFLKMVMSHDMASDSLIKRLDFGSCWWSFHRLSFFTPTSTRLISTRLPHLASYFPRDGRLTLYIAYHNSNMIPFLLITCILYYCPLSPTAIFQLATLLLISRLPLVLLLSDMAKTTPSCIRSWKLCWLT